MSKAAHGFLGSIALLLLTLLLGCSSAAGSFNGGSDSGAGSETGPGAEGGLPHPDQDGAASHDGGAKGDSAALPDGGHAGGDASAVDAGSLLTPSPPKGATECGSGTITQASSSTACMMPNWVLDSMPLPDGGTAMTPRDCSALTVTSGTWEVWCTSTEVYLWARFNGVNDTGSLVDCHGLSLIEIDEGVYSSGSGGGNGTQVATFELDGTEIAGLTPAMPEDMVITVTLDNPSGTAGSADLFVLGSLEDSCKMGAFDPETVLAGVTVTWK
jgi:hypothetical protein